MPGDRKELTQHKWECETCGQGLRDVDDLPTFHMIDGDIFKVPGPCTEGDTLMCNHESDHDPSHQRTNNWSWVNCGCCLARHFEGGRDVQD